MGGVLFSIPYVEAEVRESMEKKFAKRGKRLLTNRRSVSII